MINPHIRQAVKPYADRLGLGQAFRQLYVELNLIGERMQFAIKGRPDPSTAILLAGSGRSGTTWITELLTRQSRIQPLMEPLIPVWNADVRRIMGWNESGPYIWSVYLRHDETNMAWHHLLERIFSGELRNYWTDYERATIFPERFLIKEIRANLMLGYIYDNFRPTILYLIRHPCAVISSRLRAEWHADVQDILRQEKLVEDYLRLWVRQIEEEKDLIGAHAVRWAVENYVARTELSSRPHHLLSYEEACLFPERVFKGLFNYLGMGAPEDLQSRLRQPSRTASKDSITGTIAFLSSWKNYLPAEAQRRILYWARRLGFEQFTEDPAPSDLFPIEKVDVR